LLATLHGAVTGKKNFSEKIYVIFGEIIPEKSGTSFSEKQFAEKSGTSFSEKLFAEKFCTSFLEKLSQRN